MKISEFLQSVKTLISIAILLGISIFVYSKWDAISKFFHHSETTISTPVIESIQDLQQYVTASFYKDTLLINTKPKWIILEDHLVRSYDIVIEAGFDFGNLPAENVIIAQDSSIYLFLPEPKILHKVCNPSNKVTYIDDGFTDKEVIKIDQELRSNVSRIAISQGILEKAEENGIEEMSRFLSLLGYQKDKIHVEIKRNSTYQ